MSPAGVLLPLLLVVLFASPPLCHGAAASHNITGILAAYPGFAEFSAALSSTGAAAEIDSRNTITVLAVDDAAMAAARGLRPEELKRAVFLHVLLDYFDDDKLRNIQAGFVQAASLFQASGNASGSDGIVNITAHQGGRVAFTAGAAPGAAAFCEKSVHKSPYNISVLQVSALISSPAAAAAQVPVATPRSGSSQGRTAPVAAPAQAPAKPAPAPVVAPATAPATKTPAPSPVAAPETAPIPRRRPAPAPEVATAPSPDADDKPPADKKNGGGRGAVSWTCGATAVAAALPAAIVLVL